MTRRTYGGNKEERSVWAGKSRSGYAFAGFPCPNAEFQRYNKSKQINILKNQNQFKTCVNLHQTKGEKKIKQMKYFVFENRIIWYYSYQKEGYMIRNFG